MCLHSPLATRHSPLANNKKIRLALCSVWHWHWHWHSHSHSHPLLVFWLVLTEKKKKKVKMSVGVAVVNQIIPIAVFNCSSNIVRTKGKLTAAGKGASESAIMAAVTEKMGIKIETNPPESKLTQLGVRAWPKWGCPPSKFPWTYSSKETCFLLKGKVKVYPDGENEFVEFGAGDLVEFPKGMSCTWDVSETVDKHYNFE
ncbi:hypothetical protein AQUCO_01400027v1 [Aquilegia coerulea]|uniref:(S)-ureidoglycine aminohydrolase cupin domain-containing protein n=1 Tax=Aquilegia coerulea TaxID=218851 RepID=A0A2G5DU50_AQUCA|nr:hypothetical protein AQUCO_01400027v1 [Aquilegia coerulea]